MLFQAKTKPMQSKGKAHAAKQKPSQCKEKGRQRPSQRQAKARPTHFGVNEKRAGCSIIAMYSWSDAIDLFCLGCLSTASEFAFGSGKRAPTLLEATFQCFKNRAIAFIQPFQIATVWEELFGNVCVPCRLVCVSLCVWVCLCEN